MSAPKVLFVFNRARGELQAAYERGEAPDHALYAINAMRRRGFEPWFSDAGQRIRGIAHLWVRAAHVLSDGGRRVGFHAWQERCLRGDMARADLIFATADSSALPILARKARGRVRAPVVYATIGLTHGFPERRGALWRWYRRLLREAAAIVHFGHAEGEELARIFEVEPARRHFVPFCVDAGFFVDDPSEEDRPLSFGFDTRRDWKLLACAIEGSGVKLDVHAYTDVAQRTSWPAEARVLAPIPVPEMKRRVARARFVVLPVEENPYTGATIALLSAMAAGKAVLVTQTAAIREGYGLVNRENVLLVPPDDARAMRRAIEELNEDAALRARLGERARAHVREHLDIERMADRFASIFRGALS
ncbi:glycosyltransferase family 4 protein [bacterium]|nr:glycosyltransferase family 4 protein [bacterium]